MRMMDLDGKQNNKPEVIESGLVEDISDIRVFLRVTDAPEFSVGMEFFKSEIALIHADGEEAHRTFVEAPEMPSAFSPMDAVRALLDNADISYRTGEFTSPVWGEMRSLADFDADAIGDGYAEYSTPDELERAVAEVYPSGSWK